MLWDPGGEGAGQGRNRALDLEGEHLELQQLPF